MTSILPLFPLLSSHDAPTRLDASLSLIQALPSVAVAPSPGIINTSDDDTPYAIKRLVKGLGSSNEAARQGFAVALTELIARLPIDKSNSVLELILTTSTPPSGADSKEERDLLFARLFGVHAVFRSAIPYRQSTPDQFKEAILALHSLSGKKSWIKESAYWVLIEGVKGLFALEEADTPSWRKEAGEWLVQRLLVDAREKAKGWGPDKVALVLALQKAGVKADYASVLAPTFPSGSLLARASLSQLAQALKGTAGATDAGSTSAGPSAPKQGSNAVKTSKGGNSPTPGQAPHFVWNEIFEAYFPDGDKTVSPNVQDGNSKWNEVWRILVDQSLFAPTSLPLKATGFALLTSALTKISPSEVPGLFGEGVMRTFVNHLRKSGESEKTLQKVAEKLAVTLPVFLDTNPTVTLPLLKALVGEPHGTLAFDPKTLERIIARLDIKGVRGWVKYLRELALGSPVEDEEKVAVQDEEDEKIVATRRTWAFDQLLHVAKSGAVVKDDELTAGLLEFFAVLGWFNVKKSGKGARSYVPTPALTPSLTSASRSRFFSVLTAIPSQPWLARAVALLENLSSDKKHFTLVSQESEDDDIQDQRKEVTALYKLLVGEDDRTKTGRVLVEGVLLLSWDEENQVGETIESLKDCLPPLFPEVVPSQSTSDDEDQEMEEGEEKLEPTTILVDLLLELLHRPSAFVKGIAQTVFAGFASEVGEQALELILEQIRPEEAQTAEVDEEDAVMANGHDHSEDESEEESGKQSKKENKKSQKDKQKAGKGKERVLFDSDSEEDSIDLDEDDEESDVDVDEDFRNELLAALQENGIADEFEELEEEGEESEEELLDDDQMMALDAKLADIFKLQGGGKRGKKAEQMDDLHFRLRVIDLLDVLLKQNAGNHLLVLVVLPLFGILRGISELDKELRLKAGKLLRQIVQPRKNHPAPASPDSAIEALDELHEISRSVEDKQLTQVACQTSVFLVRAALSSPGANSSTSTQIATLFGDAFERYFLNRNAKTRLQPALTLEFCKQSPACAWPLFDRAAKLGAAARPGGGEKNTSPFRRMQAFDVAHALLLSYAKLNTDQSKADIIAGLPTLRSAIYPVLSGAAASTITSFDAGRLKDCLKICIAAVRITTSITTPEVRSSIWKPDEFSTLLEQLRESERFKTAVSMQAVLKQVIAMLGVKPAPKPSGVAKSAAKAQAKAEAAGAPVAGVKRKSDESEAPEPTPEVAKSNGKKNKKAKKDQASEVEVEVEVEEEEPVEPEDLSGKKDKKKKRDKKKKVTQSN
ncbi:hypothetical protein T439DRAFT_345128 [Meredithblackwellia eburnea MCA 4105]